MKAHEQQDDERGQLRGRDNEKHTSREAKRTASFLVTTTKNAQSCKTIRTVRYLGTIMGDARARGEMHGSLSGYDYESARVAIR